jgi:hypothetical protein
MNINLSHPGLDARRKKKFIQERLHRFNWIKVSEESEWVWAAIKSEKEITIFVQWISEQPISYPVKVIVFDYQWYEISNLLLLNKFDVLNVFTMKKATYLVSNNMEWTIEYSSLKIARFGTMNI